VSSPLLLQPEPQAVGRARAWVVEELSVLGRPDLADAAELGVSELVTNAILHADPPITVRLLGSRDQPRVEVHDRTKRPPRLAADVTDEDQLLSTVGRGMSIVALYSRAWGADVSSDGKVVWFVPSGDPGVDIAEEGEVFDLEEVLEERGVDLPPDGPMLHLRLLDMPAQVFASFRSWYVEIRRELRLLSLADDGAFPVAGELAELTVQVELERRRARGVDGLDAAIEAGKSSVDLAYDIPASAPATMARLGDLLERADRFCRDQSLLTMPATPQQLQLLRWYVGEFVRQGAGQEPLPWPGPATVEPPPA
jgi:anti-sigma regulatory factor (Ser/Thr protein kinase)